MQKRIFALAFAVLLIFIAMAGCSTLNSSYPATSQDYEYSASNMMGESYDYDAKGDFGISDDMAVSPSAEQDITEESLTGIGEVSSDRKIIKNADLSVQTTDFTGSIDIMKNLIEECGGYISSANIYVYNEVYSLHYANYTVRIPAADFDRFINRRAEIGSITSTNFWSDDVTDSYYDIEARLDSLETKRVRLLELLEKAENMENIIALETELSKTIYEIENLTGTIRRLDSQIEYSTVYIYINEVRVTTEPQTLPRTFGERISQRFRQSLDNLKTFSEDAVIWIVGASPVLILLAVIMIIIIIVIVKSAPKRTARREEAVRRNAEAVARWRENQELNTPETPKNADSGEDKGE